MRFLKQVAMQSDANKMDTGSLAVVLAPNLFDFNAIEGVGGQQVRMCTHAYSSESHEVGNVTCVYICTYVYVCTYVRTYVCVCTVCMYVPTYVCVCTVCVYVRTYVCVCTVYTYACTYVCTCMCVYVLYVCTYVCTYLCV